MPNEDVQSRLRRLPAVTEILQDARLQGYLREYPRPLVLETIQAELARRRAMILAAGPDATPDADPVEIIPAICRALEEVMRRGLRRVINGTGVVLHTNLGRAVLPEEAIARIQEAAGRYSNLELDLGTGERGLRYDHVEGLLCTLTGAESALVVNNNAAAVLLALGTLAKGKEAVVSRGQLVEIGGSFRVPDLMEQSGVKLAEVGTTNKTHPTDYRRAIGTDTALLLRVHTSNYRIIGFTAEVSLAELVGIGHEYGIPVMDDLGSGYLGGLAAGPGGEPTVAASVRAGADVITFSGDKLLGGPQAGIIIGKKEYLDRMKRNPLLRAVRIDKLTLAALEAVLHIYLREEAEAKIPTLRMLAAPLPRLQAAAERLAAAIRKTWGDRGTVEVIDGTSQAGGGSLPGEEIPTKLVAAVPADMTVNQLEARLRGNDPPILVRIGQGRLLIDPRTLLAGDIEVIAGAFAGSADGDGGTV